MIRGLVVLALVGCKGSSNQPPAVDCNAPIAAASRQIAQSDRSIDAAVVDRIQLAMIASCTSEKWTAEALECMRNSRLFVDLETCTEKLTHEQYVRLGKKIAALRGLPDPTTSPTATIVDAAVVVPLDAAGPADAPVLQDAGVTPDAFRRPTPPPKPPDPPKSKHDCSRRVVDPADAACRKQYCDNHPDDIKCQIE